MSGVRLSGVRLKCGGINCGGMSGTDGKLATMKLRPGVVGDQEAIRRLIDSVYREYGDRLFVDDADADLLDIEGNYRARGGEFIVLDDAGQIRGTHAVLPDADDQGVCPLRRLFLEPGLRGWGSGERLMRWALDWAADHAARRLQFWSDTRFERAHAFFAKFGFQQGATREMSDGAIPYREYFFSLDLE